MLQYKSALSMDLCFCLATFPRGVHEPNEDDYANNVKLSSTNHMDLRKEPSRRSKNKLSEIHLYIHRQNRPSWIHHITFTMKQIKR